MAPSVPPVVTGERISDLADQLESHRVVNDIAVLFLDGLPGHIAEITEHDRSGDPAACQVRLRDIESSAVMLGADRFAAATRALDRRLGAGHRMTMLDAERMLAIASQTDDLMRQELCSSCAAEDLDLRGTPETLRNRSGALGAATCPVPRDGHGCAGTA